MKNQLNVKNDHKLAGRFINVGLKAACWFMSKQEISQVDKKLSDEEVVSKYTEIENDRVVTFKKNKVKSR